MGLTRITAQQISDSDFKQAVRVVTTANINLSGAPSTVDGVALAANNRILVTGQSTASQNGLYYVDTVGSGSDGTWTRTVDGDTSGEITAGMIVVVAEGTSYADSEWLLTTNDPIVIGTTGLAFVQVSATIYSGSSNVSVTNSGNVSISTAGTANVITVATTGVYVSGLVSTTGNVNAVNLYISTDAVVTGNLTVNGTTTTINSSTITTNDKNITVANNQTTSANVDGAGVDAGGGTPIATWRYNNATSSWQSNVALTPTANGSLALGAASNFWGTAYVTAVSATGNITGSYILGNGSQLTGITTGYGNANVAANLAAFGSNPVSTTGNITGNYILGNGSQLTGIAGAYGNANVVANLAALGSNPVSTTGNITGGNLIQGTTRVYKWTTATSAPANPVAGDEWYNSTTDVLYKYINDGVSSQWVDQSFPTSFGNITVSGNITGGNISTAGNITGGYATLKNTIFNDTGSITIPVGNTAQRPASPTDGMIRFNTTLGYVEWYSNAASSWLATSTAPSYTIEYLIVAGGGAGGVSFGGGGGAGGYISGTVTGVNPGSSYSIVVGAGGTRSAGIGGNGSNSTGFTQTAVGGGGGGGGGAGASGGSGGGGAGRSGGGAGYNGGSATSGQGNAGGSGISAALVDAGGGGGGAGAAGANAINANPTGAGGVGTNWQSLGTYYGGGGGGCYGSGGTGGGGAGSTGTATDGTVNTGGGGGGSFNTTAGNGGSGIVIVRYQSASQKGTGGTVTNSAGYYYHTFTSSGTYIS